MDEHPDGHVVVADVDDDDDGIRCGFSAKADADCLAEAVQAKSVGRWSRWASQRVFTLVETLRSAIADVLAIRRGIDERRAAKLEPAVNANRRSRWAA